MIQLSTNQAPHQLRACSVRLMATEVEEPRDGGMEVGLQECPSSSSRAREEALQRIEPCVRYMMQHLNQPLRAATLSARAGLSLSHFFALFKRATGRTPVDFLIRVRMHLAAGLLTGTNLKIKQVAELLGYDDQFYFSRVFKLFHGLPPREYRAQASGSAEPSRPHVQRRPVADLPVPGFDMGCSTLVRRWRIFLAD